MAVAEFDVRKFDEIQVHLASSDEIRSWSRGEVKKPETINYRTQRPEKDGLFCEKIFGPIKDWECSCGKYKRIRFRGIVCERCGVEVTRSKVRRERMGHIELACPVSHIWYFKGSPSRLGYLLDVPPKDLEKVLYFASYLVTKVDFEAREEDEVELRDEMLADLESLDVERDRLIAATRELGEGYVSPDSDEIVDDVDDEALSPEEVEREVAELYEEFNERKALRQDALEEFMKLKPKQLVDDEELFREMRRHYSDYFEGGMGAASVRDLIEDMDLETTAEELKEMVENSKGQKRAKGLKRLKVVEAFLKSGSDPANMIMDVIPVIPPDLRPMVQLDGGRFATSDLNDLYRRVINRNNRLKKLLDLNAPEIMLNNEMRMLQEAVDSLFDNGRRGRAIEGTGRRPLKSLSDILKGKQGRFRQNLLGKRVDYSGRSVIVVGPELKLHQCGLPSQMALELFKPFVIKRLIELGSDRDRNINTAKQMIIDGVSEVWDVLEEVIKEHPVLLNRAPTLHRLGIQAFEPVLVDGKAIRLHPLVCTAFNADFDGDQMAVHVPLSNEAQAEARVLMLSTNNIKSPAHGRPLTVPTQDMIIGLYYLTAVRDGFEGEGRHFIDFADAYRVYDCRDGLDLQAKIDVRLKRDGLVATAYNTFEEHKAGDHIETSVGRIIFNDVLPKDYPYLNYEMNKTEISRLVADLANKYELGDLPAIFDGLKDAGFHYATRAGVTVSVYDASIPPSKAEILADADKQVAEIQDNYEMGLITNEERHSTVVDIWNKANDDVGNAMADNFDRFNPIYMMAFSGARGNIKQIRQLAGMRGLMSDPKGQIIDHPIKANFREGLSVLEYFISTHGARKGLADTALRTADSGHLTRRLVDVAQDVIIRDLDCGCDEGMVYPLLNAKGDLDDNLVGRCLNKDAIGKGGKVALETGEYIENTSVLEDLKAAGVEEIEIRTIMTCHSDHGVCQKCYGLDLATGLPVNIGTAVGIIAAQSIGEPGTQLTMRTFHTGGVAGADITHGLPRVQELFEARNPKGKAELAEISGILNITATEDHLILTIHDDQGNLREYSLSARAQLMPGIVDGCEVKVGDQLTRGSINPHDLLRLTDASTTLRYIVSQVQGVYVSQGVDINDKHIEVIARQMLKRVAITESGDSSFLPGSQVDRFTFQKVANELIDQGKEPPVGQALLLGITKASLATDSWLAAASFQETTKVLTDAAIETKTDHLRSLKENVIIGKPIPAGTGVRRYHDLGLTFKGKPIEKNRRSDEELPAYAPEKLQDIETMIPEQEQWQIAPDGTFVGDGNYKNYLGMLELARHGHSLPEEEARLYLYDDLGVSQRWANKFSEAGIETVQDLVGKDEAELTSITGIGEKAIEELRKGLESRNLLYVIEDSKAREPQEDLSKLMDIVFNPDGTTQTSGTALAFDTSDDANFDSDDEIIGSQYARSETELDAVLSAMKDLGYDLTDEKIEAESNAEQSSDEEIEE
jgi:DNA-directed RNA polymerase subunit beta'